MSASPSPPRKPSPCIGRCELDRVRRLCLGCLRTMREIEAWPLMSTDEREVVWGDLDRRRDVEDRLLGKKI